MGIAYPCKDNQTSLYGAKFSRCNFFVECHPQLSYENNFCGTRNLVSMQSQENVVTLIFADEHQSMKNKNYTP